MSELRQRLAKAQAPRESRYAQSFECGISVLQTFSGERPVLGVADIADQIGMSRATAHRYVVTLVTLGFLEQLASRKYRLAPRALDFGMSVLQATGMRGEDVRLHLEDLQRRTSHTIALAMLDETEAICVEHARSYRESESLLWLNVRPGRRLHTYCTAMGKVLLAHLDQEDLKKGIDEIKFVRHTPNTIRSKRALSDALRETRERKFAVADEEHLDNLVEIAVPVFRENGDCFAALGLLALRSTVSPADLASDFCPLLFATAGRLLESSACIGGAAGTRRRALNGRG